MQDRKTDMTEYNKSLNFLENLKEDIADCFKRGNTIDAYLKNEYGITNIMNYEFPDLKEKDVADFSFNKVRGNTRLMGGMIRSYKESQSIIDRVINFDFAAVLDYRP